MPRIAEQALPVTGGVDTHADVHVAAAVDQVGRVLGTRAFPANAAGYRAALAWMCAHGELARVGVEGTGSYGAGLARYLAACGVEVVEVIRPNRQARRQRGKSDAADAVAAALSGEASGVPKSRDGAWQVQLGGRQQQVETLMAHDLWGPGKLRRRGRARKETAVNPKVLFGSIGGVAVVLVGIGGIWVVLNFETVVAKTLELGIKVAVERGVQLPPETVKLLLELAGGAAGATAGAAGQAAGAAGRRAAGTARQAGTGAGGRVTKAARSSGQRARGGRSGGVGRPAAQRPTA